MCLFHASLFAPGGRGPEARRRNPGGAAAPVWLPSAELLGSHFSQSLHLANFIVLLVCLPSFCAFSIWRMIDLLFLFREGRVGKAFLESFCALEKLFGSQQKESNMFFCLVEGYHGTFVSFSPCTTIERKGPCFLL